MYNTCPIFEYLLKCSLDGGFLQVGNANGQNCAALLSETDFKCVVVSPAYRLAVLGFLSSEELKQDAAAIGEPCGNQGFWDQRMALEWTYKHVHLFGGNASNITVAGYSAGIFNCTASLIIS
jgi:carboxylesterase type B